MVLKHFVAIEKKYMCNLMHRTYFFMDNLAHVKIEKNVRKMTYFKLNAVNLSWNKWIFEFKQVSKCASWAFKHYTCVNGWVTTNHLLQKKNHLTSISFIHSYLKGLWFYGVCDSFCLFAYLTYLVCWHVKYV